MCGLKHQKEKRNGQLYPTTKRHLDDRFWPFASFRASHKNQSLSGAERTGMTARRWLTAT